MDSTERCHCGLPLHYTDPAVETLVRNFIVALGSDRVVTVGTRSWRVPRHYIALHGLKASEIETLGFSERAPLAC